MLRFKGIWGLLMLVGLGFLAFYAIKGLYYLLYAAAPFLLIVTLFLDHRVVLRYLKGIGDLLPTQPLFAIAKGALSVALYPFVILWLFLQVVAQNRLNAFTNRMNQQSPFGKQGQFFENSFSAFQEDTFQQRKKQPSTPTKDDEFADYEDLTPPKV